MSPASPLPLRKDRRDRAKLRSISSKRRRAIEQYRILDTPPEPDFDDLAELAAELFGTSFAAISFIDADRQWFKAQRGLAIRETSIERSICAQTIRQDDIFLVEDASADPVFATNPLVVHPPHFRFYAGMRIRAADGTPIATLCVMDPRERPGGISDVQRMTLRILARQVEAQLNLRRARIDRDQRAVELRTVSGKLLHAANHDGLTGLPNRLLFSSRLTDALRNADVSGLRTALLLINVDHLKQINDELGLDAGDAMLCGFADRLQGLVRSTDSVSRLGGDEFALVLTGINRDEDLSAVIQSLAARLREPISYDGRMVECRATIGIAMYPEHAANPEDLMKCSDRALAVGKVGRNCAVTFRPEMAADFERGAQLASLARTAIESGQIAPYYQPKIDLRSGKLSGFEALVRWEEAEDRTVLPEMFAAAFADRELSAAIGEQVLRRVCSDMRSWTDDRIDFGHVAINSCAADFAGNNYAERLLASLKHYDLDPSLLELEITEGIFLGHGAQYVARALDLLNARGMRIALDDFGTGYASLSHLKQFPVHVLKIDRSFISGIGKNPDDAAIVEALISLGQSLHIETVAEGIETVEQAAFVRTRGCSIGQGFLYARAQPASNVPDMIAQFAAQEAATTKKVA